MLDDLTAQMQPLTGERAFLGLFATLAGRTLYERHGYTPGDLLGMHRLLTSAPQAGQA